MTSAEAKGPKLPPPYRPESPEPAAKPKTEAAVRRPRMIVRNRRTIVLTFRADRWAASKASDRTAEALRAWGYPDLNEGDLKAAVHRLVTAAVADGGKRVSVHLGDQDQKVLVAVLSHVTGPSDERVLSDVMALDTIDSAGTDTGADGRRLWIVLDAAPRRRRGHTTA
ncbi:hypothetical protein ACFYN3_28390 [Streptomyces lavendulae]|uniref:hypothetical protein n=1 Tax=Streptomyces lavendulae TaxID=1914 RepID=UPI00368D33DA